MNNLRIVDDVIHFHHPIGWWYVPNRRCYDLVHQLVVGGEIERQQHLAFVVSPLLVFRIAGCRKSADSRDVNISGNECHAHVRFRREGLQSFQKTSPFFHVVCTVPMIDHVGQQDRFGKRETEPFEGTESLSDFSQKLAASLPGNVVEDAFDLLQIRYDHRNLHYNYEVQRFCGRLDKIFSQAIETLVVRRLTNDLFSGSL